MGKRPAIRCHGCSISPLELLSSAYPMCQWCTGINCGHEVVNNNLHDFPTLTTVRTPWKVAKARSQPSYSHVPRYTGDVIATSLYGNCSSLKINPLPTIARCLYKSGVRTEAENNVSKHP